MSTWVGRVMDQLHSECQTGLEKYELLADVAAMNQTLFYEVLISNLVELAPIVCALTADAWPSPKCR